MKKTILSLLVALMATTGAWADNYFYLESSYIDKTKAHTGEGGYLQTKPVPLGVLDWDASTNSGTFLIPAYDMEVNTELWYRLSETGDNTAYKTKTNVFLERTLQAGGWNTFSAPFDIAIQDGWEVKKLISSEFNSKDKELTLNFSDETTKIEAGKPYLIWVDAAYDFTADGHEFEDVTQDYTAHNTETEYADFVPVIDRVNLPASENILFVIGGNTLTYPLTEGYMNGFRAYFQVKGDAAAAARAFRMSFDGESTGIKSLTPDLSPKGEGSIYSLDGRRLSGQPTRKGVYIVSGKKTIIK